MRFNSNYDVKRFAYIRLYVVCLRDIIPSLVPSLSHTWTTFITVFLTNTTQGAHCH